MKIFLKTVCFFMVTFCVLGLVAATSNHQNGDIVLWVLMGAIATSVKDKVWQMGAEKNTDNKSDKS